MGKYFGTDGFRGNANVDLTAVHAFRIGLFLGWYYGKNPEFARPKDYRARIAVGKDTRLSSYMFEDALAAGLAASGADAYLLHVTSTPSVAYVTRTERFDCGIMISASHNPFHDNGIKLINDSGEKMPDGVIEDVERYLDGEYRPLGCKEASWDVPLAVGADIGRVIDHSAGRNRYIAYLISLATTSYKDKRIALDCSNGSTWQIARSVFDALGARTFVINDRPDGINVNMDCGSTHMEGLQRYVLENGCDCGFAFDGDADRCLAVDERGEIVNGDEIMYICARYMKEKGSLGNTKLVTTVMSNFGLYKALDELGIGYEQTAVGDKYVYEKMVEGDHLIGGEQSGHIIFRKYATTGDGMITAIKLMQCIMEKKMSLSELRKDVVMYPQVLKNVEVDGKGETLGEPEVQRAAQAEEKRLAASGRVLLRKSGTEPVLRVMAEAATHEEAERSVDAIIAAMERSGRLIRVRS